MIPVGSEMLLRYFYEAGGHQAALPVRVVEDSPARLALWLAPATEIMYWATHDGQDPRSLPLDVRFARTLSTAPRTWVGPGVLRVLVPAANYQVLHFWDAKGTFRHWYVNFEAPMHRSGTRVDTIDWHLDLIIEPDGTGVWKDEEEASAAVKARHLSPEDVDTARASGDRILGDVTAFLASIGDWRDYEPPAEWTALPLPADWAD